MDQEDVRDLPSMRDHHPFWSLWMQHKAARNIRGNDVLDSGGNVVHEHVRNVDCALGNMRTEWTNRRVR